MNTPQPQSGDRESWFRDDHVTGFQAPEQRQRGGPWGPPVDDPLTGPLPPVQSDVPASIAESQEGPYANPEAPGAYRRYAERVPRYTGLATPGQPAIESADPTPADQLPADQLTTDQLTTDQVATDRPSTDRPPAEDSGQHSPGPTQEAPVAQSFGTDTPSYGAPSYGAEPPAYGGEPQFESRTNALPTVPPTAAPESEPSIPPSLVSMLDNEYGHRTEPINRPGYAPGGPAPQRPAPSRPAPQGSSNPAVLAAVVLGTLLAVVPSVWVVYDAVFGGDRVSASGAVAGTLMLVGLPTLAAGLHPLISGGAAAPDGARAVLRAPLAYLLVGLVLLLAAGLAAS